MNVKHFLIAVLCVLAGPLFAQGFAGLGTDADGFSTPTRGTELTFPEDHGAHPDYRIEWWYVTANLEGDDGKDYGVQWTLFRSALEPQTKDGWQDPQIWMGHAALTTPTRHFVAERFARGGVGQAGVTATPFAAWIDEWQLAGPEIGSVEMSAQGTDFAYDLSMKADGPLVFQGDEGYSVKSASGQASYYYSQPFYRVEGTLVLPEGPVKVTGSAWLDREWSSQPLSDNQTGWDWFSLSFETGEKMMGFRLRQTDGTDYTSGTWIAPDGTPSPFGDGPFKAVPQGTARVQDKDIPVEWRLTLPTRNLDIAVKALNPNAWMDTAFPYWEGPVMISGSHKGRGYLEMTGYD